MFLPVTMNQVPWAKPRLNTVHTLFNLFADRRGDYSKGALDRKVYWTIHGMTDI